MSRVVFGLVVAFAALGLQMAMVVGAMAPGLLPALGGYAGIFVGLFLVLLGAVRRARLRR